MEKQPISNKKFYREFPTEYNLLQHLNEWVKSNYELLEIGAARLNLLEEKKFNPCENDTAFKREHESIRINTTNKNIFFTKKDGIVITIYDSDKRIFITNQILAIIKELINLTGAITNRVYISGDFFNSVKEIIKK